MIFLGDKAVEEAVDGNDDRQRYFGVRCISEVVRS